MTVLGAQQTDTGLSPPPLLQMIASWSIWIPAQTLNFSLVPLHLRIPFIGCVSFVYTAVLSKMRGLDEGD